MSNILTLGLTPEQREARKLGLGGSDANILLSGDSEKIHRLWLEKIGQAEPEDLSRVLPVQMGTFTEPLNRHWYELTTGRAITLTPSLVSFEYPFMRANLDGETTTQDGARAVFEAKHVNQFSKIGEVTQKYMGQLHHNMIVSGMDWSVLSVFIGTMNYDIVEVQLDPIFAGQMIAAERDFWRCVETMTPPNVPAIVVPVAPDRLRTVDMTGSNEWSAYAADWLNNKAAAKSFDAATSGIKGLMASDIGLAHGYGIQAKRAKNGAITISEDKGNG
jgi:predicted phage-related endonuclease